MKKQVFALVASGLLLASGMTFAQDGQEEAAAGTSGAAVDGGVAGTGLSGGQIALGLAIAGGAAAAASDSGGGSSGTTGTTGTVSQ
ncbi:MAG: hypothetical protein V7751_09905 [Pseudoalteromonas distincta]